MKHFLLSSLLPLLFFSCKSSIRSQDRIETKKLTEKDLSVDSLRYGLDEGRLFPSTIVRIEEGSSYFMVLDSGFFGRNYLHADERELYYSEARKIIPDEIVEVHRLAWNVLPVKEMINLDGALLTIATYIPPLQEMNSDIIIVKLVRVMHDRLAEIPVLSELRVHLKTGKVQICDLNGSCEFVTRK